LRVDCLHQAQVSFLGDVFRSLLAAHNTVYSKDKRVPMFQVQGADTQVKDSLLYAVCNLFRQHIR
jgi:hypothetical protein